MNTRKPFTPGEILEEEFMQPYNLSQAKLAESIGVARRRINEIINNKRAITPDTALRLGKFFKMTPQFWLNLQMKTDLWEAEHNRSSIKSLKAIRPIAVVCHF